MCGISGIVYHNQVDRNKEDILKMIYSQRHRGPDDENYFIRRNIALGHNRLAIIDLETGGQPMLNRDESIAITYNGEIYNYLDLKKNLEKKGYRFYTNSDTEVILIAYEEWGYQCLEKFRGMFAFGIVDFKKEKLFLARDHLGIKPLFYYDKEDRFLFASEMNAITVFGKPDLDYRSIDYYLRFDYIPAPDSVYFGVKKLSPGSFIEIGFDGYCEKPVRYWTYNIQKEYDSSVDVESKLDTVLKETVKSHLVSDVPFGVLLSGGIDSTIIACEMEKILGSAVNAYSIGFSDKDTNELRYAKKAAETIGIKLNYDIISSEKCFDILPKLISHIGEPFADSSIIPTWYVSKLARTEVSMVLSGDGGDEFFGGYNNYIRWVQFDPRNQLKNWLLKGQRPHYRILYREIKNRMINGSWNNLSSWYDRIYNAKDQTRRLLWKKEFWSILTSDSNTFKTCSKIYQDSSRLSYAQCLDINTYLPSNILYKVDIASMYHGLEVRTPLIDLKVADFSAKINDSCKLKYTDSHYTGKILFKNKLKGIFSNEFIYRSKKGFSIPKRNWLLNDPKCKNYLNEYIFSRNSKINSIFNSIELEKQVRKHSAEYDNSRLLWNLLVLGIWINN